MNPRAILMILEEAAMTDPMDNPISQNFLLKFIEMSLKFISIQPNF